MSIDSSADLDWRDSLPRPTSSLPKPSVIVYISIIGLLTLFGCGVVKGSISNYEACKGDATCLAEMRAVQDATYTATKPLAGAALPSLPEAIALIVSNIAAFGFGVIKGKKKGRV